MGTIGKKFKRRFIQGALKTVHLQLQLGALKLTAWPVQSDRAIGIQYILTLVIHQTISTHAQTRFTQAGLTFDDGVQVWSDDQSFTRDKNGSLFGLT